MTAGTVYVPRSDPKDFLFYKTWNGADGKYTVEGEEKWNSYSMYLVQESDQFGQTNYSVSTISGPIPEWSSADEFRLQSLLVKRIKGHQFNLAVDLAQANQLVNMCSKTIMQLGRAALYLKRGDVSSCLRELGINGRKRKLKSKDFSARWLEIQYGWLPFLGSVHESAKAFEALTNGRSSRVVAKVQSVYPFNGSDQPSNYSSWGTTLVSKRIVYEMEEEISFGRSLGLTDPFQVLWEITPFSFVFDWFLPVGAFLENLAVIPSLKGRFLITKFSRTVAGFTTDKSVDHRFSGSNRLGQQVTVTRTVSNALSVQLPQFVGPSSAMSGKRIANAVSLVHQLFL